MTSPTVLVNYVSSTIVKLTLNRPQSLNALNVDLLDNLCAALHDNANVRVIILEGAGDRSFCAGEDLKQTLAPETGSASELKVSFEKLQNLTRLTSSSSAIVIAAVHGFAIGGGAEIALAADFVIGGPSALFRFPEVPIGHAVTGGITLRLVHMVGLLRAKELLLTGRMVDAQEALRIGLLTELVENPRRRAIELAQQMARMPAVSASCNKLALEQAVFPNLETVLDYEVRVASYCFSQKAAAEAFANFAKRKQLNPHSAGDLNTALSLSVEKYPDRIFIRFHDADFTFSAFDLKVARLAGGLRDFGIQSGDRVLVMMRNSIEMIAIWFAVNRLGAIWVPINSELKSITLEHVAETAEAELAIVDEEFFGDVQATNIFAKGRLISNGGTKEPQLSQLSDRGKPVSKAVKILPSTVSAFLYTSGTTGRSKPCILTHGYFVNQASCLIKSFSITSDDVLYCPFPLFHADATALTTVPALLTGCIAALSTRFSASKFWDEIRASKATIYDFMGATLSLVYKQPPSPKDRDHRIRLGWGVPIPSWAEDYEIRFGHPIKDLYGSVEAGIPVAQLGDRVFGSCGTALPGYSICIADNNDTALPSNTPGNLLVRTDIPNAFFNGYYKSPEKTLDTMSNLWLHTGDLAKIDEKGNLFFLGRIKDVIRRRGETVNAFEVEEELLRHKDVMSVAAYGVPSFLGEGTEQDVKVAVVKREGSFLDERDLWEWSRVNMARFQVPTVIEFVKDLKKTPTGKVEKGGLRAAGGTKFCSRW